HPDVETTRHCLPPFSIEAALQTLSYLRNFDSLLQHRRHLRLEYQNAVDRPTCRRRAEAKASFSEEIFLPQVADLHSQTLRHHRSVCLPHHSKGSVLLRVLAD